MSEFNRNDYLEALNNNSAAIRPEGANMNETAVETTVRVNRLHEMINAGERVSFPAEQLPALVKNLTIGRAQKVDGTPGGDWALINGQEGKRGRNLASFSEVRAMLNLILDLRTGRYPYAEIGLHIFYSPADLRAASSIDRVALVKSNYTGPLAKMIVGLTAEDVVTESTGNEYLDLAANNQLSWHDVNWRNGQFVIGKKLRVQAAEKGEPEAVTAQRRTVVKHDMLDLLITGDPIMMSWSGWKDNFVATFIENMSKSIDEIKAGRVEGIVAAKTRVKTAQVFEAVKVARETGQPVPATIAAEHSVLNFSTNEPVAVRDLVGKTVILRSGKVVRPGVVEVRDDNFQAFGAVWSNMGLSVEIL